MASDIPRESLLLPPFHVLMTPEEEQAAVEAVAALLEVASWRHHGVVDAGGGSRSHPSSPLEPAKWEGGNDERHETDGGESAEA